MIENNKNKRLLIILAIILGLILIVAIIVGVSTSMQSVKTIKPSRLNDRGWEAVTSVLDEGGVALFTEANGRGYLIVGRGSAGDGTDYRDCRVKFHDRREDGQRIMHIDIDSGNADSRGYQSPDVYNHPLAIYQFKLQNADQIELRIDGKDEAFTAIVHEERQNIFR